MKIIKYHKPLFVTIITMLFVFISHQLRPEFNLYPDTLSAHIDNGKIYINGCYYKHFYPEYNKGNYSVMENLTRNDLTDKYIHTNPYLNSRYPKGMCGFRSGYLIDGKQDGAWTSILIDGIIIEEHFKMGLRDSVYRVYYENNGKEIYSTYFNMGTGFEKQFHRNGQLYYEIAMVNGYYTDTLRIYNDQGFIVEKLLFDKEVLVFYQKIKRPNPDWIKVNSGIYDRNAKVYMNGRYLKYKSKDNDSVFQELSRKPYIEEVDYYHQRCRYYPPELKYAKRTGRLMNGEQEGCWLSKRENSEQIYREEYFKQGLRDSVYRIYDINGDTIYSTMFNMGTGIEKDFHKNGALYYEIVQKNGYFTDTLNIYDEFGGLVEQLLFQNDSLIYHKNYPSPVLEDEYYENGEFILKIKVQ